jgi:hypothetical protein
MNGKIKQQFFNHFKQPFAVAQKPKKLAMKLLFHKPLHFTLAVGFPQVKTRIRSGSQLKTPSEGCA